MQISKCGTTAQIVIAYFCIVRFAHYSWLSLCNIKMNDSLYYSSIYEFGSVVLLVFGGYAIKLSLHLLVIEGLTFSFVHTWQSFGKGELEFDDEGQEEREENTRIGMYWSAVQVSVPLAIMYEIQIAIIMLFQDHTSNVCLLASPIPCLVAA